MYHIKDRSQYRKVIKQEQYLTGKKSGTVEVTDLSTNSRFLLTFNADTYQVNGIPASEAIERPDEVPTAGGYADCAMQKEYSKNK